MTSEYLRYFIEVCNCGSIQNASKNLFVSAQGIGQGIQRLEKSVGVKLLERTQNGARPTQFGLVFYEQACVVERELKKLEQMAEDYRRSKQTRIVIGTLGENKFLSGVTACAGEYIRQNPGLQLEVSTRVFHSGAQLLEGVRSGEIDIGWTFHWREHPDLRYYTISDYSRLVLLTGATSPLAARKHVSWEQLKDMRLILPGSEDPFSDLIRELCADKGFTPQDTFYSGENYLVANLVDNGIASILLRENYYMTVMHFCKNAVCLPLEPEVRVANSLFVSMGNKRGKEIHDFLSFMIDYFRDTLGLGQRFS